MAMVGGNVSTREVYTVKSLKKINYKILGATIHRLWFTGLLSFKGKSDDQGMIVLRG